ncbi:hypothetical protein QF036_002641 [Arthrobacter globiformis]|nr:hypothetical protein [Arthrobacter globiformis]
MTEPTPGIPFATIEDSPQPSPACAPSPTAAVVFHDPLSGSLPEGQALRSHAPLESSHRSSTSNRFGPKHLKKSRLAARAAAIEAVSRELQLLAQRRGKP